MNASTALKQLAAYPNWVCGNKDKVPYNPNTGRPAKANDPQTWGTYEQAETFLKTHKKNGFRTLGFEVGNSPFTAVDLDHCRRAGCSEIDDWADEIVSTIESYCEISPSGTGLRIFVLTRNDIPPVNRKRGGLGDDGKGAIEIANTGKYFSVTGNRYWSSPDVIAHNTKGLQKVIDKYFPAKPEAEPVATPKQAGNLEDAEIIQKASNARNGPAFRKLYEGDWSDYPSRSEADLSLCSMLSFWCGGDVDQIDRIFRSSGLMRAKWEREGYRQATLTRAIEGMTEVYRPPGKKEFEQQMLTAVQEVAELDRQEPPEMEEPAAPPERPPLSSETILAALSENEDGDARLFQELHRGEFCFDASSCRWYQWSDHGWQKDIQGAASRAIDDVIDLYLAEAVRQGRERSEMERAGDSEGGNRKKKLINELFQRGRQLHSVQRKANCLTLARTGNDSLSIVGDQWDADPWVIGTPTGVINLKTGKLRPGRPDDYIKSSTHTPYHGVGTPAPVFEKFISEIFDYDQGLVAFVQRLLGYAIVGITTEHIVPILHGAGRNGKTTLIETVSHVLGGYACQVESEMLLSQKFARQSGGPSADIMSLRGKRFVHASETESGRHFAVSKLKTLSGGDRLTGRDPYGREMVTFSPSHTIFLSTNHRPHASSDDYALWKRALLIPFGISFVSEPMEANEHLADPRLPEKLRSEASGVLSWLVRGCLAWQQQGLNPPEQVRSATESYRHDEDIIGHFITDRCAEGETLCCKASVLYEAYRAWCSAEGLSPLNGMNFGMKIRNRFEARKTMHGVFYHGLDTTTVL